MVVSVIELSVSSSIDSTSEGNTISAGSEVKIDCWFIILSNSSRLVNLLWSIITYILQSFILRSANANPSEMIEARKELGADLGTYMHGYKSSKGKILKGIIKPNRIKKKNKKRP